MAIFDKLPMGVNDSLLKKAKKCTKQQPWNARKSKNELIILLIWARDQR
jgi:hypothetical protein